MDYRNSHGYNYECEECEEIVADMEEDGERGPDEGFLLVRIHVPELNVQKCLQFPRDQLVWDVKQQCLAALPKELKESFNYGLFCPPENGRAGKFLDEERRLGDYPFNGPVGYLELKYKRRVYKMTNLDEKQLKSLHTRTNLRRFLEYVINGQVEKVTKMCSKGLDPNFHCHESGETPLTLATGTKKPPKVLIALVNGGALLDYRTKDGATAMHRAIEHKTLEGMKTLLELGSSPNYKDGRGLTPLYLAITHNAAAEFAEALLHDHATIGTQDLQGWQEIHQACRTGLQQHLEHLLFYGADMNARNASGNTPLHVCAVNNQESCTRQLLFRGADRQALNYANQSPYQVAVIAGNMELADVIQQFRAEDVVLALGVADKNLGDTSDIISDSSGVGTANSDTTNGSLTMPGATVVCTETYTSTLEGHLNIREGDIIEVTGSSDTGLLEGTVKTGGGRQTGLFPPHCVQEVRLRHHNIQAPMMVARDTKMPNMPNNISGRVIGRRENTTKHFATAPRLKKIYPGLPSESQTVVLHRGRKGFGFILRGAKATSPLMELTPSEKCPALQYLDDVDPGGVADRAGLKKGDFLLEINNEDVSSASHEHVVDLIRKSGDLVSMTVVSLGYPSIPGLLPSSKSTVALPGGTMDVSVSRQCATLPRKLNYHCNRGVQAPLPPRRDPKTTLTVGRARAKSLVAGLGFDKEDLEDMTKSSSAESIHQMTSNNSTPVQPRTASIKQRPTSSRITSVELEELFQRQRGETTNKTSLMSSSHFQSSLNSPSKSTSGRVYASVSEMKRSKSKNMRVRFSQIFTFGTELRRDFHSTPDLANQELYLGNGMSKCHRSQEDIAVSGTNRNPPPNHPPPPPPIGQLIKVDISRSSEYDNCGNKDMPDKSIRDRKNRIVNSNSSSAIVLLAQNNQPPPIPEPDYSCSGSEAESDDENKQSSKLALRLNAVHLHPVENSGNSNTSGSSTGSSSVPHSFSVEEIQRGRTLLKSSKSYPDDFLKKARDHIVEDADNSSSGVSSDQDVPAGASEYNEKLSHEHNSMTLPSPKTQRPLIGLSRNAVSLAQLPPPIEADTDEKDDYCLPPPPEFNIVAGASQTAEPLIAPPPQFSDNRQVTRVRIVGAVHKETTIPPINSIHTKLKQGRLNSQ